MLKALSCRELGDNSLRGITRPELIKKNSDWSQCQTVHSLFTVCYSTGESELFSLIYHFAHNISSFRAGPISAIDFLFFMTWNTVAIATQPHPKQIFGVITACLPICAVHFNDRRRCCHTYRDSKRRSDACISFAHVARSPSAAANNALQQIILTSAVGSHVAKWQM